MKRFLILAGTLLCLTAPMTAFAQIDLAWDECGAAGEQNKTFACTSNTILHQMVSSFIAPAGITHFIGATTEIIVATNQAGAPPWWQFDAAGCRSGALSSEDPSAIGFVGCSTATFDGSVNLGLANYERAYEGNIARAKITVDMARTDQGVALEAGTEYQANVIQIRSTKTVGTGACAGCLEPVCLVSIRVFVAQPTGAVEITGGANSFVTWQGGAINNPAGCPGATPARKSSWGSVKSLYR